MPEKNTLLPVALLAIFIASSATASPLDARDDVSYVKQGSSNNGWVNVSPATGGIYVHGASDQKKRAVQIEVFMVGKPSRQDFVFLSAQEQEEIWKYRQGLREAMRKAALPSPAAIKTSHKNMVANLSWPRVIVEGDKVCVPGLDYSDADDWKDHLLCTYLEPTHGQR